jgi:16S rRNA (cytidine1402-2'-O)-methyltransferase
MRFGATVEHTFAWFAGYIMSETNRATVYIIATPIGTLADCSQRARDVLALADFVACEDTRRTKELLQALSIPQVSLVSLHEHNEEAKCSHLIERLQNSKNKRAALVSDAGTPAVSDPGALFINACHMNGVKIENIPGPSSLVCALASSGFIQPRTIFSGFLARNNKDQREEFKRWLAVAPCIAVCFESPNRVLSTLRNAADFFPAETKVCLSREISKKFEEHLRMTIHELAEHLTNDGNLRGECILTFNLTTAVEAGNDTSAKDFDTVVNEVSSLLIENPQLRLKEVIREHAAKNALQPKDLYNAVLARRRS